MYIGYRVFSILTLMYFTTARTGLLWPVWEFDDLHTSIANIKYSYLLILHILTFVKANNELIISEQMPYLTDS